MSSTDRHDSAPMSPIANSDEVLDVMPDIILELTRDGRYVAFHIGPEPQLYASPEKLVGKHYGEVLPEAVTRQFDAGFDDLRRSGETTTFSYMLPREDELEYYECRLLPLKSDHVVALIRNMTDSWRAKTELQQSASRYRTLVNNIPGLVYRCAIDDNWTTHFVSDAIEEMVGYDGDEFISQQRGLVEIIHPEDRNHVQQTVRQAVDADEPFRISYRMIDADGEVRHAIERGQAIYAEFDETRYLDGVIFDVTELHKMRQRVLVNSKMAAVGNLAAGVAHEINNPLTVALANLEYVAEELGAVEDAVDDDPPVVEALKDVSTAVEKIQGGIDRVRNIIDNLRTFTDAAESQADHVDITDLVDWAIRRKQERVDCDGCLRPQLDSVAPVWASEVGLVQVVWNLIDNGLEAIARSDKDGVVDISLTEEGDRVYLVVSDNGPGMKPEVEQRALEPFYTTKSVGDGAGLGLFVCQGLVDGMDGTIDIETTPGKGTTVRVSLPAFEPSYSTMADA